MHLKITKNKVLVFGLLLAITLLFILPPSVYSYDYPTTGDDTFRHIQHIKDADDSLARYPAQNFTLLMYKSLGSGMSAEKFFVFFNWYAMAVISLCLFYFGKRLWNWQAGLVIAGLALFSSRAMSYYFYNGTIYNIINMYVFVLMGMMSFLLWQREKRTFYMVVSLLLFCLAGIYHSSSGLVMIAGMLIYLAGSIGYYCWKRNTGQAVELVVYSLRFGLVVILPAFLLNSETLVLGPYLLTTSVIPVIGTDGYSSSNPVPFMTWMFDSCSPWVLPLIMLFSYMLWQRRKIMAIDWRPLLLLCSFIAVMALGSFTRMWMDHPRFALELGIFVSILCGGLAGMAIKSRGSKVFNWAIAVVIIGSGIPTIYQYAHYSSTYTPADKACVEYLNNLEGNSWNCSSQVHPELYGLFVTDKFYNNVSADYTIYRSRPITPESDPDNFSWNFNQHFNNSSEIEDYQGMEELDSWSWGNTTVTLYRR